VARNGIACRDPRAIMPLAVNEVSDTVDSHLPRRRAGEIPGAQPGRCRFAHFLKYVHAASANKASATIQRDESLIPVFLAMGQF